MQKKVVFTVLLSFIFIVFIQAQEVAAPTIQSCGSSQQFCIDAPSAEVCVNINVEPGSPIFESFEVDWGDDTPIQIFPGGNQSIFGISHVFDLADLYNCSDSETFSSEFTIKLKSRRTNDLPLNSAFDLVFINNPKITMASSNLYCVGEYFCFNPQTCAYSPDIDPFAEILWDYGDGSPETTEICHKYDVASNYTVRAILNNYCGSDTIIFPAQAVEKPIAGGAIYSGIMGMAEDTAIVCLGGGGVVRLNGDSLSLNELTYEWTFDSLETSLNWINFPDTINPNISRPYLAFTEEGLYPVYLEVNNNCGLSSSDTLYFKVFEVDSLHLDAQSDACLNLEYKPSPFRADAVYKINGAIVNSFPAILGVGDYHIQAELTDECGLQVLRDTFRVGGIEQVTISLPRQDTAVCVGTDRILLQPLVDGGVWSGDHLVEEGGQTWFDPVEPGNNTLTYSRGVGACEGSASIHIRVEGIAVQANDYIKCSWSENFVLEASPLGGNWASADCPNCIAGDTVLMNEVLSNGSDSISLTYTVANDLACEGRKTIQIKLLDPNPAFSILDSICVTDTLFLETIDTSDFVNIWRLDGVVVDTPPYTNLLPGWHYVERVNIIGACRDSLLDSVYVTAPPQLVDFLPSQLAGCADFVIDIDNTSQGQDLEFSWYIDEDLYSNEEDLTALTLGQGYGDTLYTLRLEAVNACGSGTAEEGITVFPKPIPNFGTLQSQYCSGDSIRFINVTVGSSDIYLWDFGNGTTYSGAAPPEIVYLSGDSSIVYPVSLIVENSCGRDTLVKDIEVGSANVTAFIYTENYTACLGEAICFESYSTPNARLEWNFGDGTTSSDNNICHTYERAGRYDVILKAFGCGYDSVIATVNVLPPPTVDILTNQQVCPGQEITFAADVEDVVDLNWKFTEGDSSTAFNPSYAFDTSGQYTVFLVGESLNGCKTVDSTMITVVGNPQASFETDVTTVCSGDPIRFNSTAEGDIVACIWKFGDGGTAGTCSPTHTYTMGDNFTVTHTVTNINGCRDSVSQIINIFQTPEPDFTHDLGSTCTPATLSITNESESANSFTWNFENNISSNNFNPVVTYDSAGIYNIELIASNGYCTNTINKPVTIHDSPKVAMIASDTIGCLPLDVNFEATTTENDLTYFWTYGDGSAAYGAIAEHEYTDAGEYTATIVVANSHCEDSVSQRILVVEAPKPRFDLDNNLCAPFVGLINNETEFADSYIWDLGNNVSNAFRPVVNYEEEGVYTIQLTAENQYCTRSTSQEIIVHQTPNAQITVSDTIGCIPLSIDLDASTQGEDLTYFWNYGDGSGAYGNTARHEYREVGIYNASVVVASPYCSDSTSQVISAFAAPEPSFTVDLSSQCAPFTATLVNQTAFGNTYRWDLGNGDFSASTNPNVTYTTEGIYDVVLTAENDYCSRSYTQSINAYKVPEVDLVTSTNTICALKEVSFTTSTTDTDISYNWNFKDGQVGYGDDITHVFDAAGTYDVVLKIENQNCSDSIVETVTVFPEIQVDALVDEVECHGTATGNIRINITQGTAPFQYQWADNTNGNSQINIVAGDYSLSITDSNGCEWEGVQEVIEPEPLQTIVTDTTLVTCYGYNDGQVCIAPDGGIGDYQFLWSNGATTNCLTDATAGEYTLTLTDGNGCTTTKDYRVYQNPSIEAFATIEVVSCFGLKNGSITIDSITGGANNTYNISVDGPLSFDGGTYFGDLIPGEYQVMVFDVEGCVSEQSIRIDEPDSIWVSFHQDTINIDLGDSILLSPMHNIGNPVFTWLPAGGECADCEEKYIRPYTNTNYEVEVTSPDGCVVKDQTLVLVKGNRKFYIPNTFTPNGDGKNDRFNIRSRLGSIAKVNAFRIYDRWGEMVFERTDFRPQEENDLDGWDGTFRGVLLNPDMYTYYAEVQYVDGLVETVQGTVTLVR